MLKKALKGTLKYREEISTSASEITLITIIVTLMNLFTIVYRYDHAEANFFVV